MLRPKVAMVVFLVVGLAFSSVKAQGPAKAASKHYKVADIDRADSISPDGGFVSRTDWSTGRLAITDLKSGESRYLTSEQWPKGAFSSKIAPDGKRIAYEFDAVGSHELRIINLDGSGNRVLLRSPQVTLGPLEWSPDGNHIVTTFSSAEVGPQGQIVLISVLDGSVRVLRKLPDWRRPVKFSFSPDGRHIAYDFPAEPNAPQLDIFLLSVEGGPQAALVQNPGNDLLLGWTPGGERILFASENEGRWQVWSIAVSGGKPKGRPDLIRSDLHPIEAAIGFRLDGSYYYVPRSGLSEIYVAEFDESAGKLQLPKKLVGDVGRETSPAWSPDGSQLAYVLQRPRWELHPLVLVIRPLASGEERRIPLELGRFGGHAFQPEWSPDGQFLLVQARNHNLQQGIYRIDAQNGTVAPIVQMNTCPPDCVEWPVWSPDGRVIFNRWTTRSIVARQVETGVEEELQRSNSPGRFSHLAISPDGQQLAFVWSDRNTQKTVLKIMRSSGGEPSELVELPATELISAGQPAVQLAWMPDSRHIIYLLAVAGEKPKLELWRIPAEGGEPENLGLAKEGVLPYGLSVHPGGKRIAFTAGTPLRRELWVLKDFLPARKGGVRK